MTITFLRNDFRLQYFNLKISRSQNALSLNEMQKLWIPFLVFENTEKNEATVATGDTELTVLRFVINCDIPNLYREGNFIGSEDDNVEEINIFEGTENRIIFEQVHFVFTQQKYAFSIRCTQKPSNAPISSSSIPLTPRLILSAMIRMTCTQVCNVLLKVRKLETAVMMITPHMIAMESETTLTQYIIKNWSAASLSFFLPCFLQDVGLYQLYHS